MRISMHWLRISMNQLFISINQRRIDEMEREGNQEKQGKLNGKGVKTKEVCDEKGDQRSLDAVGEQGRLSVQFFYLLKPPQQCAEKCKERECGAKTGLHCGIKE